MTLACANWWVILWMALGFSVLRYRTATEEAMLLDRFGAEYRDYMTVTGRFFPRLVG